MQLEKWHVAQLAEQAPVKRRSAGSSPAVPAYVNVAQLAERLTFNQQVAGSIPAVCTLISLW